MTGNQRSRYVMLLGLRPGEEGIREEKIEEERIGEERIGEDGCLAIVIR